MRFDLGELAYCTNIHPAETWQETRHVLENEVLAVRRGLLGGTTAPADGRFAIGLRLSARAAAELEAAPARLDWLRGWLVQEGCHIGSINGFPYGNFHGTRVKEQVFLPDWTSTERDDYTRCLFRILCSLAEPGAELSVSTLPGSHKFFRADESKIRLRLIALADWLEEMSLATGHDLHLGLEPEPLGHFENASETLAFFERLRNDAPNPEKLSRRIGINYDTCHFAIEFDSATASLDAIRAAGIRISKIHLSSALELDPHDPVALDALKTFDEPTYFHQVVLEEPAGNLTRFPDLPEFFAAQASGRLPRTARARVHFHIPLDADAVSPLGDTRSQVVETLAWCSRHPGACGQFEIETYTWGVLPGSLANRCVTDQIIAEYRWVLGYFGR